MIDTNYIHQYITHIHFRHTLPYVLIHKNINIKSLSKRCIIPPSLTLHHTPLHLHTLTPSAAPSLQLSLPSNRCIISLLQNHPKPYRCPSSPPLTAKLSPFLHQHPSQPIQNPTSANLPLVAIAISSSNRPNSNSITAPVATFSLTHFDSARLPSLRLAAHASDTHTATHGGGPNDTTTMTTITDFPFYVDASEYAILQWLRHVARPKSKEDQPPAPFCKRSQAPRTSSTPPDTLPVLIPPPPPPRYPLFFSYPGQSNPLPYPTLPYHTIPSPTLPTCSRPHAYLTPQLP
jgi:hypothetical protein